MASARLEFKMIDWILVLRCAGELYGALGPKAAYLACAILFVSVVILLSKGWLEQDRNMQ